jgi:hypothetical protein
MNDLATQNIFSMEDGEGNYGRINNNNAKIISLFGFFRSRK